MGLPAQGGTAQQAKGPGKGAFGRNTGRNCFRKLTGKIIKE